MVAVLLFLGRIAPNSRAKRSSAVSAGSIRLPPGWLLRALNLV
jgi:hypothetical protein